jgi:hypothetical protein
MKQLYFLVLVILIYGCSNTTTTTTLPYNRPDDIKIEFVDVPNQKVYYISKDSSYCIFKLDSVEKRIDMDFTDEALDKLYNAFTNNTFDRIDTVKLNVENLSGQTEIPYQSVKLSWSDKSIEKFKTPTIGLKPIWEEKFTAVMSAVVMAAQDMMDKSKIDFKVVLDKSLQNESNFITIDVNTYNSIDPLDSVFYYNSNENGIKDTLEYRLIEGKNRMAVFYNRRNPQPGEGFMIANNTFDFNVDSKSRGLLLSLEKDSVRWNVIK